MIRDFHFKKDKEIIFCVDSDGCVMDTMNYKHTKCFGPLAADIWDIQARDVFLSYWNDINLFSKTRGVNRFKGLILTLKAMQKIEPELYDFSYLAEWVYTTSVLSNNALQHKILKVKDRVPLEHTMQLERALTWSINVNKQIMMLSHESKPFEGARTALELLFQKVHIAVISSANRDAIVSEWQQHRFMHFVDIVYGQESGSKSSCIRKIFSYGFKPENVLMIGDAPGDLYAAKENKIDFYPILFGKEEKSWRLLYQTIIPKVLSGTYKHSYQNMIIKKFKEHLKL